MMMDATKGLKNLLAVLDAHKSRGWAAHNEFDYFTLCPTCGYWFDCRNPENLVKHKHTIAAGIAVTTIVQTSGVEIRDSALPLRNSPPSIAVETPDLLPETPVGGAKP